MRHFRRVAVVATLAAATLMLGGCITSQIVRDLTPDAKRELALKFLERCGGTVRISAGGASGQMGGAIKGDFDLVGVCPTPGAAAGGAGAAPVSRVVVTSTPDGPPPGEAER